MEDKDNDKLKEDSLFIKQVMHAYKLKEQANRQTEIPATISQLVGKVAADYKHKQLRRSRYMLYWKIAGFTVSIAALFVIIFINRHLHTDSELFSAYYEVPSYKAFHSRGESCMDIDKEQLLQQADSLYQQANYHLAAKVYDKLIQTLAAEDVPESVLFYRAACLMEEQQYDRALVYFTDLQQGSLFKSKAKWYAALIYLKKDRKEETESLLKELIETETPYVDRAKQLLTDLENLK